MKTIIRFSTIIMLLAFMITSCEKGVNTGALKVDMTDTSTNAYEHIYIDLKQISVHYENSQEGAWMNLATNEGSYDLLTLANGITINVCPESRIPIGRISQI